MNASVLRPTVIFFAIIFAASADEKKVQSEKSDLITRVYSVPAAVFLGHDSDESKKKDDNAAKKLPPTQSGEARYDVLGYFVAQGMPAVPGSRAILLEKDNAVVVTTSIEGQELAGRMLFIGYSCDSIDQIEITAALVEYDDDPFGNGVSPRRRIAEIKALAGESFRVVDAFRIVTKQGQRAIGLNKGGTADEKPVKRLPAVAKDPAPDITRLELDGARGSLVEIEPNFLPDRMTVEMMLRYEGRLRQGDGRPDAELKLTTNIMVVSGQELIAYSTIVHDATDVGKGKIRMRTLVVGAQIFHADNRTSEERRIAQEAILRARDAGLIRKATEDLGEPKRQGSPRL